METINMFKKGDKYIHFTKYGGVNRGEVLDVQQVSRIDTVNKCIYYVCQILTTKGILLQLDGSDGKIYKIREELSEERLYGVKRFYKKISDRKNRPPKRIVHCLDEDKET